MDLCDKREDMVLQGGDSCLAPRLSRGGCEMESQWAEGLVEGGGRKRRVPEESDDDVQEMDEVDCGGKRSKPPSPQPHTPDIRESHAPGRRRTAAARGEEHSGGGGDLIGEIGRDLSINCLLRLSRSEYGSVASLNRNFRSIVRGGEIYRLRRQNNISEHWVYFSCNVLEWDAYDPYRELWISVPKMPRDECFLCSAVLPGHPCPKFFAESDTPHPCRIPTLVSDSKWYLACPKKICRIGHPHPSRTPTPAPVSM
ncbi:unnamed protein product [Urochloa humidicola]